MTAPLPISCLIVDCDGTLVHTSDDIAASLNHTLSHFKLPGYSTHEIAQHVGFGITPLLERYKSQVSTQELLCFFGAHYLENCVVKSKLYDGWLDLLPKFPANQNFILSNKPQNFLDSIVKKLNITQYFNKVYGREAFAEKKPSAVPILGILEQSKSLPKETMIIGDTEADIISGKNAGILTCAVSYGYQDISILEKHSPDFIINTPQELSTIIQAK